MDDADAATAQATLEVPPTSRAVNTGAGLSGGGDLSTDRTLVADPAYHVGLLHGFVVSDGSDATNDKDIGAGVCVDPTGTRFIKLAAGVTRQIDVAFGTGNGGLSLDLVVGLTNTTYHWFAVVTSGGVASVGIDTSVTAANLIADHGITHFRRIFSLKRVAGALQLITQQDDTFLLKVPVQDVSGSGPGTSAVLRTLTVPGGVKVEAIMGVEIAVNTTGTRLF